MATEGQQVDLAAEYSSQHARAQELVTALVGAKFGNQGAGDPRRTFLADMEMGRITARVELNAFARILQDLLGIKGATVVAAINHEMGLELERLEEEVEDLTGTPGRD